MPPTPTSDAPTALVVVDLQADRGEDGARPVPGAARLAGRVAGFLDIRAKRYAAVAATLDRRREPDALPHPAVAAALGRHADVTVVRNAMHGDSALDGVDPEDAPDGLAAWLGSRAIAALELVGIGTGDIRATALDALDRGFAATVLTDLCLGDDEAAAAAADAALAELEAAGVLLATARPGPRR